MGYLIPDRIWKLKDVPTIDFTLCAIPGHQKRFELMLRAGEGVLQSLHAFRHVYDDADSVEPYRLPVLVEGNGLQAGQVVELGVRIQKQRNVSFPTMQIRESLKQPNFLWANTPCNQVRHAWCEVRPWTSSTLGSVCHW